MKRLAFDRSLFRHRTDIQLRYADIDMLQHVNNARYLTFLESARTQYARDVLGWDGRYETLGMVLANTNLDFVRPTFFDDKLWVLTRTSYLGGKSFRMQYIIENQRGDEAPQPTVFAEAVLTAFDVHTQRVAELPASLRERVLAYESNVEQKA